MSVDLRLFLPVVVLASTLAGLALYFGPNNEAITDGYMRHVPRHHDTSTDLSFSMHGQAEPAESSGSPDQRPGVMRRVKPRHSGLSMDSPRALDRPMHFLVMLCTVTVLVAFAHQVWGRSPTDNATNKHKVFNTERAQTDGKLSRAGAATRALSSNPALLLVFVTLAFALAGCALYFAGPSHGMEPGVYMRRVPRHGVGIPSTTHMHLTSMRERPNMMRSAKPRAPETLAFSQQGPHRPMHFVFMFSLVAALTSFAHQVWGTIPTRQDANEADGTTVGAKRTSRSAVEIVALTKDPRHLLAFVAFASTLVGCALHFAGPSDAASYMRRMPHHGNSADASAKALEVPKALEDPPRVHFLFALCVVVALIAFAYQVWGRLKTLRRSSTDTKAPKA